MVRKLEALGQFVADSLRGWGELALIALRCFFAFFHGPRYRHETIWQFYFVGVESIPVILTTGAFTGAVLAYSAYDQFLRLGVASWTGALVAKALVWQLGPVLVGLMLAGRVGCAMTAELGTMSVTEQVDALETMGIDPIRYLVLPRVLACMVMTPVLTAFAMLIGIYAGMWLVVYGMGAEPFFMWAQIRDWMVPYDYVQGLSKALVFGIVIALICCRNGIKTTGGAEGVGKSTTAANVASCIAVLILNLFLTMVLNYLSPVWDALATLMDAGWLRVVALWGGNGGM